MPAYVTAVATFLSLIYPNQGLDRCLTREHIERMDGRDFQKVMHVRPRTSVCTQGWQLPRSGPLISSSTSPGSSGSGEDRQVTQQCMLLSISMRAFARVLQ